MIVYRELKTLGKDLGFPVKTLYALSNNLDKHYRDVSIPKRDKTMRKLSVPDFILKSVQRSIVIHILAYYPVSRFACAYRYGASVQKNAKPHIGKKKLLKLDIEGFFDHILYSQVKDYLQGQCVIICFLSIKIIFSLLYVYQNRCMVFCKMVV